MIEVISSNAIIIIILFCCRRNYGFLAFQLLLPAIQIILFCLAIGHTPSGLRIAVVNDDMGYNNTYLRSSLSL